MWIYCGEALSFIPCSMLDSGDPFGAARHYLAAPPLHYPRRGSASRQSLRTGAIAAPPPLAPLLGELVAVRPTEGTPVWINEQSAKEKAHRKQQCIHPKQAGQIALPVQHFIHTFQPLSANYHSRYRPKTRRSPTRCSRCCEPCRRRRS